MGDCPLTTTNEIEGGSANQYEALPFSDFLCILEHRFMMAGASVGFVAQMVIEDNMPLLPGGFALRLALHFEPVMVGGLFESVSKRSRGEREGQSCRFRSDIWRLCIFEKQVNPIQWG